MAMNLKQQILIFRTCLATLVTLRKLVKADPTMDYRTAENLEPLIKQVNDEVNRLYDDERTKK